MHYRYLLKLDVDCVRLSINLSLSSTLAWIIAILSQAEADTCQHLGRGSSKSGRSHLVQTFHFLIMVRLMTPESLSIHYTVYMYTVIDDF